MSLRAIIWALSSKTGSPSAKLVLIKLADNANDAGICWPSLTHICAHTELSERAVRDQIRRLETLGLVHTEERYAEGVRLPNIYRLQIREDVGVGQEMPGGGAPNAGGVGQEVPGKETVTVNGHLTKDSAERETVIASEIVQSEFPKFYEIYPRRVGRRTAETAYRVALGRASPEDILAGAGRYATATLGSDRQFVKHPATWLNSDGWLDEHAGKTNGHGKSSAHDRFLAGGAAFLARLDASEDGIQSESEGHKH